MNDEINLYWAPPHRCAPGTWAWFKWDIRKGWDGPYRMIREKGFRLFGLEVSWEYMERA